MNDRPGISGTESGSDPETSVPQEEDPIAAFIRSSLRAAHPPGKIAMTLEQHSPGLGRAYLEPIHALARELGAGRRPDVSRQAVLNGLPGGSMPIAPDVPPAVFDGRFPGRGATGRQQPPASLFTGHGVPQFRRARATSLGEYGLPLRSAALPVRSPRTGGLLQPLAAKSTPVRPLLQGAQSTPSGPQGETRKRRYHYPIDDLSVEPTANPTSDPYQHPGYLGFIGSPAESGGGKNLMSDGSKDA